MKALTRFGLAFALSAVAISVPAQETGEVQQLHQQLQEMKENFERVQKEQRAQIEALQKQLDALQRQQQAAVTPATSAPPATATAEQVQQLQDKVNEVVEAQKKILPGEFNPAIGVVGETIFSYHRRGADQTGSDRPGGFDAFQRSVELNVSGSVDPFAKAWVVANASADAQSGEANFGIEEAALETTSLPANLTLTAGRFFGEFGRLGYIHDHELPFVNRPLALDEYIGGESRTDGLQLNWLPPLNQFVSLTVGVGDSFGGDSPLANPGNYRVFSEANFWGRLSTYFDLTPDWQLEAGVSGLWNPNTDDRGGVNALTAANGDPMTEHERRLAGLDFKVSYVPLRNNEFRSLTWGTELLYSDNRYLVDPDNSLNPASPVPGLTGDEFNAGVGSLGLYSYVTYKWHRQWSGGFLFDWVQDPQNHDNQAFAYSPYLTWALSHWNQLRLQYTHTDHSAASGLPADDAVYLQWAWIIGAHSHGWTQR